ncbi:MAG TPA: glycosyltransferase family A protein [Mycobacteriales bacterium]|nr:glycosyltransferase family A protein [Mycobacteriales bacterium]
MRLLRRRPVVTVVIPTWNWSSVLPWSIASVRGQTVTDLELLVIGDGCTDDSAEVVAAARDGDRRVRWTNLPTNAGTQVVPNNEALRRARGLFIAYLGHDDLWLPTHLEHLLAAIGDDGSWAHSRWLQVDPGRPPFALHPEGWTYAPGEWLAPTACLQRVTAVRAVGGWRHPRDTGSLDPESDLSARLFERFGPPRSSPLTTALKLPAAYRPGIYTRRPDDEQRAWAAIIAEHPDPEDFLRVGLTQAATPAINADMPAILADPVASALERHHVRRRWKGIEPT